ncbi:hypothetical protein BC833DRAFT_592697 [Globomyces pollinis-pini]|nr:hypothetical protein BC833DRAFT_592697 [Globomyces pollinis-pini]
MDTLLQIGYWSFLPQIGTSILQSAYYQLRSKPAEGTPEYKQHKKNAFITVIILYLIYSIYQENAAIPTNFYEILQISPLATDKQIKIQHRQLSLLYHPDKVQSTDGSSENYFIEIRNAYEILKDPVKRVAYDHFGIKSFECVRCYFYKDYFSDNISSTLAYYAITVIVVSLLSFMKNFSFGRYWRFTSLIGLGAFELYFLVNESDPLPYLFHWRTISEKIILLRHIFMVSSIAILQLGPVLFPYDKRSMRDLLINELEPLLIALNEQSKVQLNTNMHAFDVKSKGFCF